MGIVNYRKYSRVEVEIGITFFIEGADSPGKAYLSNLSEEGASLIYRSEMPIATSIEFDIPLPKSMAPVHVRADILWSRAIYENGENVFAHGLLFNRIGVEDRERLHTFIANAMSY